MLCYVWEGAARLVGWLPDRKLPRYCTGTTAQPRITCFGPEYIQRMIGSTP